MAKKFPKLPSKPVLGEIYVSVLFVGFMLLLLFGLPSIIIGMS